MSDLEATYQAGVCNIGPAEISRRRITGWIGTGLTIIAWITLILTDATPAWYIVLWLPAVVGAVGFAQARSKFCVNYGMRNMFNFGALGSTEIVADAAARRQDRVRSWQIVGIAAGIATIVMIVGVLTA